MRCNNCKEVLPKDSIFCPYCGFKIESINETNETEMVIDTPISADERERITNSQHYFDDDFGLSPQNPMVVSSISMMGYYLAGFRTQDGKAFTWKRGESTNESIDRYDLYLEGEFYKTIFFNCHGNNTDYLPHGIVLDAGAFDAARRGLSPEEYAAEIEANRIAEENAKALAEKEAAEREVLEKAEAEKKILKAQKRKKVCKRILVSVICLILVCSACFCGYLLYRVIQYNNAIKAMDNAEYTTAITQFQSLNGYKDSEEKSVECYYLYAEELLNSGNYDIAKQNYSKTNGYKDSNDKINECDYIQAKALLEQGKYSDAKKLFNNIISYKDSKECIIACTYGEGVAFFEVQDYVSSYNVFKSITNFEESEKYELESALLAAKKYYDAQDYANGYKYWKIFKTTNTTAQQDITPYDTSFALDLQIKYSEELIEGKKDSDINKAIEILSSLEKTEEISEIISRGENQLNQNKYDTGIKHFKKGEYEKAVNIFEEIIDYSDSEQQWLKSMYEYVQEEKWHFVITDSSVNVVGDILKWPFYSYAKKLSDHNYEDSKAYYKELSAWKVSIVMNASETNETQNASSISKWDTCYAHIKVSGGPLLGNTRLRYVFTMSNGGTVKGSWDFEMYSDSTAWCCCYYERPEYAPTGTCYVKIYDINTGELLAQDKIRVIN